jgi:type IV secretion system protein VirB6
MEGTAAPFHFYSRVFAELNGALNTYVSNVAENIIVAITPVTKTLLAIYVILWGWSIMRGMIQEPIIDGTTRLIRLSVIVAIALNLGRYNTYISDSLWGMPDALAIYVASGHADSRGNVQFLDSLMSQCYELGVGFWQKGRAVGRIMPDFAMLTIALFIWAVGLIVTAYGAFLFALSKIALAILLGLGPLFVLLLIFDSTKRFFELWMGQALNYVFLAALTAATVKLILTILQTYLTDNAGNVTDPGPAQALPAIAICIIGALVMMQLSSIAAALGGGTAISTMSAATWAYSKAKGTAAAMRPTNLKQGLNKAREDARIAGHAARAAGGAPMAVYRKITQSRTNRVARS